MTAQKFCAIQGTRLTKGLWRPVLLRRGLGQHSRYEYWILSHPPWLYRIFYSTLKRVECSMALLVKLAAHRILKQLPNLSQGQSTVAARQPGKGACSQSNNSRRLWLSAFFGPFRRSRQKGHICTPDEQKSLKTGMMLHCCASRTA